MTAPQTSATDIDTRTLARLYGYRHDYWYVRIKLRTDPLYAAVFDALSDRSAPLLDIGCGMGVLAFYLSERGYGGDILGSDYDAVKVNVANRIASQRYPAASFLHGDAREGIPESEGNVTILDILQFFTEAEQAALLRLAASRVAPGCRLILRSGLREPGWRFRVTHAADVVANLSSWMKDPPVCYPTRDSIDGALGEAGLRGTFGPLWGRTPFNNYLIVYERASSQASPNITAPPP